MMRNIEKRLIDFSLYIAITAFLVATVFLATKTTIAKDDFFRWLGLIGFTFIMFTQFVLNSRQQWENRSFWYFFGAVALAHTFVVAKLGMSHLTLASVHLMIFFFLEALLLKLAREQIFRTK